MANKQTPYVVGVSGNVKAGAANVAIGEKTLIVGASRSGKTSILNNIEYALTSGCSDVAGRAWSTGPALAALRPASGAPMHATVTMSDGAEYSGASLHAPRIFPLAELLDALSGTSERFRREIVAPSAGAAITRDAIRKLLSSRSAAIFDEIAAPSKAPLVALTDAIAVGKSRKKEQTAKIKGMEASLQALQAASVTLPGVGAIASPAPTNDRIATLRAELAESAERLTEERTANENAQAAHRARVAQIDEYIGAWRAERQRRESARDQVRAKIAALQSARAIPADKMQRIAAVRLLATQLHATNATNCGLCFNTLAPGQAASVIAQLDQISNPPPTQEESNLIAQLQVIDAAVAEAANNVAAGEQQRAATPAPVPSGAAAVVYAQRQAALQAAEAAVAEAERVAAERQRAVAQQRDEAAVARVRDQIDGEREALAALDRFVAEAQTAAETIVAGEVGAFERAVNERIPESFGRFKLDLSGNLVRWGLARGEQIYTALSGAEYAIVATAIASIFAAPSGPVRPILVPPERFFDATTLSEFMGAIEGAPVQVIILSTVRPRGRPRKGWTVIDLGGESGDGDRAALPPAEAIPEAPPTQAPAVDLSPAGDPWVLPSTRAVADWSAAWEAARPDAQPGDQIVVDLERDETAGLTWYAHQDGSLSWISDDGQVGVIAPEADAAQVAA